MFITSRESAMFPCPVPSPIHQTFPLLSLLPAGLACRTSGPSIAYPGALGVQSIYQPRKAQRQSESPRFTGFYAHFLESAESPFRGDVYMLWCLPLKAQLEVVFARGILGHSWAGN